MSSLNIKLHSFDFLKTIINSKDSVRVNITVIPEMQKQSYTFDVGRAKSSVAQFTVQITENTKQILIVFQKIGHFSADQLLASNIFQTEDLLALKEDKTWTKQIDIYESLQTRIQNNKFNKNNYYAQRKVVGTMMAQFSLSWYNYQVYKMNKENLKNNKKLYKN